MPKHSLRKSFKSLFQSHVDPEKDKSEVEGKFQKILNILKTEDDKGGKEKLKDMIKDFYNQYCSLFDRYDHLTEALRRRSHAKQGKRSSSSSSDSDSDSDDSPKKNGTKFGKFETDFNNSTGNTKQELEIAYSLVRENEAAIYSTGEEEGDAEDLRTNIQQLRHPNEALQLELEAKGGVFLTLKGQLESAEKGVAKLSQIQKATEEENNSLSSQILLLKDEIKQSQKTRVQETSELRVQIETIKEELMNKISEQQKTLEEKEKFAVLVKDLELKINSQRNLKGELEEQLRTKSQDLKGELEEQLRTKSQDVIQLHEEKEKLKVQNSELDEQASNIQDEGNKLREEKAVQQRKNFELQKILTEGEDELIALQKKLYNVQNEASFQITALSEEVTHLLEEKEHLWPEKSLLEVQIERSKLESMEIVAQLEYQNTELQNKIRDQDEKLKNQEDAFVKLSKEHKKLEVQLQEKLYNVQNEASFQITALSEEVTHLLEEKEHLWPERSLLEVQIERSKQESMEIVARLEYQNTELQNKIRDQDENLKNQEDAFVKLSEEHKKLEVQFQNSEENPKTIERQMGEIKEQFQKDIDRLEENIEDLKRNLEMKGDEVNTLVENLRNTEVKLRLTSQKLRITEQLLAEKEDSHRSKEEKLQEQQKLLVERVATMTGTIETYRKAQLNTAKEISEKVNDTLTGIDSFSVKFEECYGHLESRICKVVNELDIATNWIRESNGEKDHLKMEIANFTQQLKDMKEQELVVRAKVGQLKTTVLKDANEKDILTKIVKQGEEKVTELEKMIKERDEKLGDLEREMNKKDMGFLTLAEEKREAIKQLCILIDYHRNRYDYLISKPTRGRRQIAT